MEQQSKDFAQIHKKLDLLLINMTPDEWLTPQDVQRIFKIGKTQFWELVSENAFPVSRPKTRTTLVKRTDVEAFLRRSITASPY